MAVHDAHDVDDIDGDFATRHFGLFAARSFVERTWGGSAVVSRSAVESAPCIVLRANAKWRFIDAQGHEIELKPRARFAVNDPRAAVELTRRGLGVYLAPLDAVADGAPDLMRLRTPFGEPAPLDLFIVYPSRRLLPRRVRQAIDWLTQPRYAPAPPTR